MPSIGEAVRSPSSREPQSSHHPRPLDADLPEAGSANPPWGTDNLLRKLDKELLHPVRVSRHSRRIRSDVPEDRCHALTLVVPILSDCRIAHGTCIQHLLAREGSICLGCQELSGETGRTPNRCTHLQLLVPGTVGARIGGFRPRCQCSGILNETVGHESGNVRRKDGIQFLRSRPCGRRPIH